VPEACLLRVAIVESSILAITRSASATSSSQCDVRDMHPSRWASLLRATLVVIATTSCAGFGCGDRPALEGTREIDGVTYYSGDTCAPRV